MYRGGAYRGGSAREWGPWGFGMGRGRGFLGRSPWCRGWGRNWAVYAGDMD